MVSLKFLEEKFWCLISISSSKTLKVDSPKIYDILEYHSAYISLSLINCSILKLYGLYCYLSILQIKHLQEQKVNDIITIIFIISLLVFGLFNYFCFYLNLLILFSIFWIYRSICFFFQNLNLRKCGKVQTVQSETSSVAPFLEKP